MNDLSMVYMKMWWVIGFPLVLADSKGDMPGIKPGPLGWHHALTTELQEVRHNN